MKLGNEILNEEKQKIELEISRFLNPDRLSPIDLFELKYKPISKQDLLDEVLNTSANNFLHNIHVGLKLKFIQQARMSY